MEEYQPRKQPPQVYRTSHNLAQQPSEQDDVPLEEDANVVRLPKSRLVDGIAEDPLQPRSTKRKQSSTGKGRSTTSKKAVKTGRSAQAVKHTPFIDELQQLEAMAERINQILAERSQRQWGNSSQSRPPATGGQVSQGWAANQHPPSQRFSAEESFVSPLLTDAETENLKRQAQQIRQRLTQLESFTQEVESRSSASPIGPELVDSGLDDYPTPSQSFNDRQTSEGLPNAQARYPQPFQQRVSPKQGTQPSVASPQNPPELGHRSEYETWLATQELRRLQQQAYPTMRSPIYEDSSYQDQAVDHRSVLHDLSSRGVGQPDRAWSSQASVDPTVRRYSSALLRNLRTWRMFDLPQKTSDRLGDAAIWMAVAVVVRVSSRYFLLSFPFLTPVVTLLMLTPAAIALLLVLFAPRVGWVPLYRLFLITLGLFIGGKF